MRTPYASLCGGMSHINSLWGRYKEQDMNETTGTLGSMLFVLVAQAFALYPM